MKSLAQVHGGYGWHIGNGESVSLWFDVWLAEEPLCIMVNEIDSTEVLWTVYNIISPEGVWSLYNLKTNLPCSVIHQIYKIQLPAPKSARDVQVWKSNIDGLPTASSFFKFLSYEDLDLSPQSWAWIWKLDCPQKLRFFVWLIMHDCLPVNAFRYRIGATESNVCDQCQTHSETIIHMLCDCP